MHVRAMFNEKLRHLGLGSADGCEKRCFFIFINIDVCTSRNKKLDDFGLTMISSCAYYASQNGGDVDFIVQPVFDGRQIALSGSGYVYSLFEVSIRGSHADLFIPLPFNSNEFKNESDTGFFHAARHRAWLISPVSKITNPIQT
jgi:hypothetical protein